MFLLAVTGLLVHCVATDRISSTEEQGRLSGGRIISAKYGVVWSITRFLENIPVLDYEMKIGFCGWGAGRHIKKECGVSDSGPYGHSNAWSDEMQLGVASLTERSRDYVSAQRWGFPAIYYLYADFPLARSGIRGNQFNRLNRYPSSLVNFHRIKLGLQLAVKYPSGDDNRDSTNYLNESPPGRWSALFGLIGILVAWFGANRLDRNQNLFWGSCLTVSGIILCSYEVCKFLEFRLYN